MAADSPPQPAPLSRSRSPDTPVPGRLGVMVGFSLLAGNIPVPFVPDRVLRHLRGAVAHEVASRHGLSLSGDAREALAKAHTTALSRWLLRKSLELTARSVLKRLGPLAPMGGAAGAIEVYALGHLLDRYFREVRPAGPIRLQEPEAKRVRKAIDRATRLACSPSTEPTRLLVGQGAEDLRDGFTRGIDSLLAMLSTLPSYIERRLDSAFDDVVRDMPELRRDH